MNNEWANTKETILGHPCLKHRHTGELSIFGEYGEIWLKNSSTCRASLFSPARFGVKSPDPKYRFRASDEWVVEFPVSAISKYLKLLRVTNMVASQMRFAAERGGNHA